MRRIVERCREAAVAMKIVPGLQALLSGRARMSEIREVRLDPSTIREALRGRRGSVTGAGGSIGSEICRQVAAVGPALLVLLDRHEGGSPRSRRSWPRRIRTRRCCREPLERHGRHRAGWAHHRHPPGDDVLLHDDPRGRAARAPRLDAGPGRGDLRAGDGRARAHHRAGAGPGAALGARAGAGYRDRLHGAPPGGEALRGAERLILQARRDLENARKNIGIAAYEVAAFLAHQSVEK